MSTISYTYTQKDKQTLMVLNRFGEIIMRSFLVVYIGCLCDDDASSVGFPIQRFEVILHPVMYGASARERSRDVPHQNSVLLWFCILRIRLIHASEMHHMLVGFPEPMHGDYGEPVRSDYIGPQTFAPILQNQWRRRRREKGTSFHSIDLPPLLVPFHFHRICDSHEYKFTLP